MDVENLSPSNQYTGLLSPSTAHTSNQADRATTRYHATINGNNGGDVDEITTFNNRPAQDLAWSDTSFTVSVDDSICPYISIGAMEVGNKSHRKHILTNCWGMVRSGELCAILGPSGSGKTSLLNVLAGRTIGSSSSSGNSGGSRGSYITCKLFINGQRVSPSENRQNIAYLTQSDGLVPTTTPREALAFSAHLRLLPMPTNEINRYLGCIEIVCF